MYYNFKKHLHRNNSRGGGVYLSPKVKPKVKRPERKMKSYLNRFWLAFPTLSQNGKLNLLQDASREHFTHWNNYEKIRKQTHRMTNHPCRVCGKQPTITHHIILLKNGGFNKHSNLIRLCELCHAKIHDWLIDEAIEKLEKKEFADYYSMFNL